jgi:hypothetical protein
MAANAVRSDSTPINGRADRGCASHKSFNPTEAYFRSVLSAIAILRLETIIRSHRAGFQLYPRQQLGATLPKCSIRIAKRSCDAYAIVCWGECAGRGGCDVTSGRMRVHFVANVANNDGKLRSAVAGLATCRECRSRGKCRQRCETTRWTKNDISKCKSGESRRRPLSIPASDVGLRESAGGCSSKAKAE